MEGYLFLRVNSAQSMQLELLVFLYLVHDHRTLWIRSKIGYNSSHNNNVLLLLLDHLVGSVSCSLR